MLKYFKSLFFISIIFFSSLIIINARAYSETPENAGVYGPTQASIKVLTYNICWECLSKSSTGSAGALGKKCEIITVNNAKTTLCGKNIGTNIDAINKKYQGSGAKYYDFIAFQEARDGAILKNFTDSLNNNIMSLADRNSLKTFYNKKRFHLKQQVTGSFSEDNRPFQILIFQEPLIFVNIHAPHAKDKLKQMLETELSAALVKAKVDVASLQKNRIILAGDFNDHSGTLLNYQKNMQPLAPFAKAGIATKVFLNNIPADSIKSCCSTKIPYGDARSAGDYIFDSLQRSAFKWLKFKVPSNYDFNQPASDHLPVIYEAPQPAYSPE